MPKKAELAAKLKKAGLTASGTLEQMAARLKTYGDAQTVPLPDGAAFVERHPISQVSRARTPPPSRASVQSPSPTKPSTRDPQSQSPSSPKPSPRAVPVSSAGGSGHKDADEYDDVRAVSSTPSTLTSTDLDPPFMPSAGVDGARGAASSTRRSRAGRNSKECSGGHRKERAVLRELDPLDRVRHDVDEPAAVHRDLPLAHRPVGHLRVVAAVGDEALDKELRLVELL